MESQSLIQQLLFVRYLLEQAKNNLRNRSSITEAGCGLLLIQDAVELYLFAMARKNKVPLGSAQAFDKILEKVESKLGDLTGSEEMRSLNKYRVAVKHYASLPNYDQCLMYLNQANDFIEKNEKLVGITFSTVSLVDLIGNEEVKTVLKEAERALSAQDYYATLVNCRKAIFFLVERRYDIAQFRTTSRSDPNPFPFTFCEAPFFVQNKEYIEERVQEPFEYIVLDHARVGVELLELGLHVEDFWNVWRVTPKVYFDRDSSKWLVKDCFYEPQEMSRNGPHAFHKTVEIALAFDHFRQRVLPNPNKYQAVQLNHKTPLPIYPKASKSGPPIGHIPVGQRPLEVECILDGFGGAERFYHVMEKIEGKYIVGYVAEEDLG